ncbi:MAG: dolichyl-phosphate beta-glucosyltransferase [Armatimonadota bacterium]
MKNSAVYDESHPFLSVIIPAYNEESRIVSTLGVVEAYLSSVGKPCEIIMVDDGSSDVTLQAARAKGDADGVIRIVTYQPNRGKGYAVRQGVYAARGEYIAFSDADLSAPIEQLGKLFDALEQGYDIAIGSRAAKGADIPIHQPFYREFGGKALNRIIQLLAVSGIKDTQCGFKLFRGNVARDIFSKCLLNGWGFDVEVLYLARRLGFTVAEVPVKWSHMEGSKIHPFRAAVRVIADVIAMRCHRYDLSREL